MWYTRDNERANNNFFKIMSSVSPKYEVDILTEIEWNSSRPNFYIPIQESRQIDFKQSGGLVSKNFTNVNFKKVNLHNWNPKTFQNKNYVYKSCQRGKRICNTRFTKIYRLYAFSFVYLYLAEFFFEFYPEKV